jgi:hypothetical protein
MKKYRHIEFLHGTICPRTPHPPKKKEKKRKEKAREIPCHPSSLFTIRQSTICKLVPETGYLIAHLPIAQLNILEKSTIMFMSWLTRITSLFEKL